MVTDAELCDFSSGPNDRIRFRLMYGNSRRPACKHFNQTHIPSDMELLATILVIVLLIPWSGAQNQSCGTTYKEGDTATLTFTLSADFKINFPQYISVEFYRRGSGGRPGDHLVDDCYLETDDDLCKTTNERITFQRLDSGRSNVLNIQKVTDNDEGSYLLKLTSIRSITLQACIEVKKGDDSTRPPSTTPNAGGSSGSSSDSDGAIVGGVLGCAAVVGVIVAVVVLCWRRKKNRQSRERKETATNKRTQETSRAAEEDVENNGESRPVNVKKMAQMFEGTTAARDSSLRPGNPDGRHGGRDEFKSTQPLLADQSLDLTQLAGLEEQEQTLDTEENEAVTSTAPPLDESSPVEPGNPDGRHGGRNEFNESTQPLLADQSLDDSRLTQLAGPEEKERTLDTEKNEAVSSTAPPYDEGSPVDDDKKATEEEVATRDVKVAPGEEQEPIQETTKATEETGGAEEEEASGSAGGPTGQGHQTEGTAVGSPGQGTGHVAAMKDRFENQKQTPGTATARSEEGM